MKTIQGWSSSEPSPENLDLALVICCPECKTQRAFKINDSIRGVIDRLSAGMEWETLCEDCRHKIVIQIAWTKRGPGWTARRIKIPNVIGVEDDAGGMVEER